MAFSLLKSDKASVLFSHNFQVNVPQIIIGLFWKNCQHTFPSSQLNGQVNWVILYANPMTQPPPPPATKVSPQSSSLDYVCYFHMFKWNGDVCVTASRIHFQNPAVFLGFGKMLWLVIIRINPDWLLKSHEACTTLFFCSEYWPFWSGLCLTISHF